MCTEVSEKCRIQGRKRARMTGPNFLKFLKHFIKYSHSYEGKKRVIVVDNHESHITLEFINEARANPNSTKLSLGYTKDISPGLKILFFP